MNDLAQIQAATAERLGAAPDVPNVNLKVGIASNVRAGLQPVNALRHTPQGDVSGWYIWAGEVLSQEPDFFIPLHISHLPDWCPELLPYLALPPGWRVLLAPGYEDTWFDDSILL